MPGITSKNVYRIMNKVENLIQLSSMTQNQLQGNTNLSFCNYGYNFFHLTSFYLIILSIHLSDILENERDSKQLWNFLHQDTKHIVTAAEKSDKHTKKKTLMKNVKRKR